MKRNKRIYLVLLSTLLLISSRAACIPPVRDAGPDLPRATAPLRFDDTLADSASIENLPELRTIDFPMDAHAISLVTRPVIGGSLSSLSGVLSESGRVEYAGTEGGIDSVSSTNRIALSRWAIKANVLYYAILMPNIEGEYYFTPHLSANASFQIAWWKQPSHDRFYQIWLVSPEVRYWPGRQGAGNGLYLGIYGLTGAYDLKSGKTGYWSDYVWSSGMSFGYVKQIRKHFALEFGLGLGYMKTQYEVYDRYETGHYVYKGTDRTTYFGPTKAVVGLAWKFGRIQTNSRKR